MTTGNMHKIFGGFAEWFLSYASGQTDRHTHHTPRTLSFTS